jgi:[acyl-carrier-protein] S-malonyltransferase
MASPATRSWRRPSPKRPTRWQFDLGKLIAEGPKEELDLTTNTQPVMLTAAVAAYRAWIAAGGPVPSVVAGHSLGEYSALVAAGVIDFKDAVPLVRFRAQAMQEAVPVGQGGMAVVLGLSDDDVRAPAPKPCRRPVADGRAGQLQRAAQVVIAGHTAAVERACEWPRPRAPSAPCAAGVGAVPLVAAQAGFGPPARLHGRISHLRRRRSP